MMEENEGNKEGREQSWFEDYTTLLEQGPALVDVGPAFDRIAKDLHRRFAENPLAVAEEVLAFLAANHVQAMLRSFAVLRWAQEEADRSVNGKQNSALSGSGSPVAEKLERQEQSFLSTMALWAKVRHTMRLGEGDI